MSGPFVWTPSEVHLQRSNVARFMKRHGIPDYPELIRRSTGDLTWFWSSVVDHLGLEFFEPYHTVLDDSRGIAWTRWFLGGKLNVAHNCVDRHAGGAGRDRVALIAENEEGDVRRLTYGELRAETCRLANAMKRLGIGRGDRVGIFLPMRPEAPIALLATARIGAIAIPIFSGFGAQAVATRLNDGSARLLLTADGFRRKNQWIDMKAVADQACVDVPSLEHRLILRSPNRKTPLDPTHDLDWRETTAREADDCPAESMDAEDPFLIAYTSGTTGKPKGSVHVHGGFLVKIAQEVAYQVDMTPDDTLYWYTDMGWIMGPWEVVGGLAAGGTIFLYDGAPEIPGPDRVWDLVERHGVTILGLSPTLIRSLMRHGEEPVTRHNLARLRILASTGEPWNHDPWIWYFQHAGGGRCPIINFSGGTEAGACLLSCFPITPLKPCTLAGPSLGMDIDAVDPEGHPVRGGVGELICRKPWPGMTRGLWNDPDRYVSTYWTRFPGVWTHGDWATIDEDGLWFLHGRSDDTLNVAGKRIGPAEIESVLVSHPAVGEAAAIGVPHALKGEAVWGFVVLQPGQSPSDSLTGELRADVAEALGKSFVPDQIRFVSELPRTRSAKVLRRAIRACVLQEDPGDLSSLENPTALEEIGRAV